MRAATLVPMMALVAGCALAGAPRPSAVRLSPTDLVVMMQDGRQCRADWSVAPQGRMGDCGIEYDVRPDSRTNPLAQVWQGVWTALAADGAIRPQAQVLLTDADGGQHVFASPPPPND